MFLLLFVTTVKAENFFNKNSYRSLVSDNRAIAIGDTVTVLIAERSRASSQAGTKSNTNFDSSIDASDSYSPIDLGVEYNRDSDDGARTSREGLFSGQISARVVSIDKEGLLFLEGKQELVINGEYQTISLSGFVRPIDIKSNNTVTSNRLSDAKIVLSGEGVVDKGQSPNLFTRVFSWLGF